MDMSLQDRIQEIVAAGFTPSDLARAAGKTAASVTFWLNGQTKSIKGDSAAGIEKLTGYSAAWIATGKGQKMAGTPPALLGKPVRALAEVDDSVEGQVHVPLLANAGSMGTGNDLLHDDVLVGHIALSETWVARRLQPTSQNALRFIHAYGDSMSPTFEDGDVLLVDTGMRDPKAIDGVYVMAANDRLYVKRVRQRLDGSVEISSDNANVKTVDVLNGGSAIDVLGRVVWCWNGRKL